MIIKRLQGFYIINEKTQEILGGPYNTEDEAKEREKDIEPTIQAKLDQSDWKPADE